MVDRMSLFGSLGDPLETVKDILLHKNEFMMDRDELGLAREIGEDFAHEILNCTSDDTIYCMSITDNCDYIENGGYGIVDNILSRFKRFSKAKNFNALNYFRNAVSLLISEGMAKRIDGVLTIDHTAFPVLEDIPLSTAIDGTITFCNGIGPLTLNEDIYVSFISKISEVTADLEKADESRLSCDLITCASIIYSHLFWYRDHQVRLALAASSKVRAAVNLRLEQTPIAKRVWPDYRLANFDAEMQKAQKVMDQYDNRQPAYH